MAKTIIFGVAARRKLMDGIDILANAVKKTMGPKGKVAIFQRGNIVFSLDGVTVAQQIELEDKVEAIGCELVKEIATKTDKEAGDGTTAAVLLSQVILKQGLKAIASGIDTIGLKKGMEQGLEIVVKELKKISRPVKTKKDMADVATIASRDTEIGNLVADIMDKVGKEAIITVQESNIIGLHKEIVEGMQFDSGFISPYMINHQEKGEAILENPYILTTTQAIRTNNEVIRVLEAVAKTDSKNLLVIAEDVSGEALATLVINKMRGSIINVAVKAPGVGEDKRNKIEDISILTGGAFVSEEVGMKVEDVELEHLGRADRVIVGKNETIIIGGKGKKADIKKRVSHLQSLIKEEDSEYYKEIMKKRTAKLKGGVAIIRVGTISPQENMEMRFRIEDAVLSTKSAIEEGIVVGGGMALMQCSEQIEKEVEKEKDLSVRMGLDILAQAIKEPARQIIENTGKSPDVILERVKQKGVSGYNSATGEYGDLMEMGVVDPVKVIRTSLENAVSVVGLFLITESVIVEAPKKDEDQSPNN